MDSLDNIDDRFDEMCEEFIDNVFGYENRVDLKEFTEKTSKLQSYMFSPTGIREKVVIMLNTSYVS